ncbi:GNAT family N-acetyltransferase [Candidatus Peregrinibacteria bacterium]|nr:GNAT family N-acetyltransferase [Candidatus Peregrinibacteria bacterium]
MEYPKATQKSKLAAKAKSFPPSPGIYKMRDKEGNIIYVGKAKDLKKRITSYFRKDYQHSTRTRKLLENCVDIEYTQTDSELEALLLENNFIKEYRPRYNILMKDDKSYAYIKIDLNEDFPRIRIVRESDRKKSEKDNSKVAPSGRSNAVGRPCSGTASGLGLTSPRLGLLVKYFGPKLATSKVYETLRTLKKLFPFRHCQLDIEWRGEGEGRTEEIINNAHPAPSTPHPNSVEVKNRVIDYPCLDYFIKRCPGPCIGAVSPVMYKKVVQQIIDFLNGKSGELEKSLKDEMMAAVSQKLFEKAARIRNKLFAIQSITEHQKVTDLERQDTDVINFVVEMGRVYFNVFMVREGKLVNQENFAFDALEMQHPEELESAEILESFLIQYYEKAADIPSEVFVPEELESVDSLEKWLTRERGKSVKILNPKKGEKNKLLALSLKNAESFAKQYRIKWLAQQRGETALAELAEVLNMKGKSLKRIEGFDISHLGGTDTVASMVVFENGVPKFEHYRSFKMRTVVGKPDDYASMEEVLMRRFKYLVGKAEDKGRTIRMPIKKDFEVIKKTIADEKLYGGYLNQKDFLAIKEGKNTIGFGRIFALDNKVFALSDLWVSPKSRGNMLGHMIIKKLVSKFKLKRVYMATEKELEEYYSIFGFTVLHEPPAVLVDCFKQGCEKCYKKNVVFMVYDALKHKTDVSFSSKPDLVMIDGGKGQLSTALMVLKRLKLEIPVISLAKRLEEIYVPGAKAPILLEEGDEALKLLQRIRDESHRFAITFQRELHRKGLIG